MADKQVYTPHKSRNPTNPIYYHESAVKLHAIPLNLPPEPRRSDRIKAQTPTTQLQQPLSINIGGQSTSSSTTSAATQPINTTTTLPTASVPIVTSSTVASTTTSTSGSTITTTGSRRN